MTEGFKISCISLFDANNILELCLLAEMLIKYFGKNNYTERPQ